MGTARAEYTRADSLTAQARGGRISYYLYDGHGDVRALLDEAGAVTDRYRYSAYGELTEKAGNTENHYLYTGEYYDGTSGLYYLRARYMDPSAGRFLTMDTYEGNISDPVTLHKYLYANGNPVMYNDPSGHFSCATQAVATAIHDTLQTMYNVNLMGLMSGISNVAVNSVLGKQGMELVSSFFEGYQNGLYLTSILYLTVAVQVCALSVPVQAAYASTFMGMSAVNVAMSTVMFVASVMEHNDREILLYGTLLIVSLFEFSSAHNMYCEVTVQGGKGSNTLVYDGRKGGDPTELVPYYPSNDGALAGTEKNIYLMKGDLIDRYGGNQGKYFSPMGTPAEMRALPHNTNLNEYHQFVVVKPFEVEASTAAPAFGKIGLGIQYRSSVKAEVLVKKGIIKEIGGSP